MVRGAGRGVPGRVWLAAAAAVLIPGATWFAGQEGSGPLLLPDRIKADVLVVLAHPDDEGVVAPLLARWALEEKQRVFVVYLTSGEFGVNRVGAVKGPAFGYLRLTELHWTLDRLGVAMFQSLGRSDRGSSDDPAEVLVSWDRERTVRELTRYIRLLRPDRLLTWFPGPASAHVDHMASGAAALLAARASASPDAHPEQMATEGLRPHAVPRVLLFAQPEKVGYDAFPARSGPAPSAPRFEEIPVNVPSPVLGRRYTDLAREAMREQRAVSAAANLGRGGPFDQPLRLIDAFEGPEGDAEDPSMTRVRIDPIGDSAQVFLETVAAEVGARQIVAAFLPQDTVSAAGGSEISIRITNAGEDQIERARVEVEVPKGWKKSPAGALLSLPQGGGAVLSWVLEAPSKPGPTYIVASCAVLVGKGKTPIARASFVLKRAGGPAGSAPPGENAGPGS